MTLEREPLDRDNLTPEQEEMVDRFFPEITTQTTFHSDPETGETVSDVRDVPIWENDKEVARRDELIEFFIYPERFEASDFAFEVVCRRHIPGAPESHNWNGDVSDIDLSCIRNVYVTIDSELDANNPPSINVHAEVRANKNEPWKKCVAGNWATSPDDWYRRKAGSTPLRHDFSALHIKDEKIVQEILNAMTDSEARNIAPQNPDAFPTQNTARTAV